MSAERILVVEDNLLTLSVVGSRLQAQGYEVTRAPNIAMALQAVQAQMPDLLILDLTVLDADPFAGLTDGFAFLTLLRRNHPAVRFPVVIYTVDTSQKVQARAKTLEVAEVFGKDRPIADLLALISRLLERREHPQTVCPAA
jgi:DNA-binding response OmpR family regulator